ncbi:glycosyltransferase family 2 protein [Paenibacillus sp. LHD-38]|uniref:glycosyltransferase n=1 Tax=Paenibacillus sp. LHD-38 TaxID=3072143 RepID=UPI00280C528B|nr:glycosyltransferase family 2 protein [Paenibacillus sp. LHD-38]MDQ8735770.1 glycosyltransferase family 2 protein [Paenibacillus sp. LHD-38]
MLEKPDMYEKAMIQETLESTALPVSPEQSDSQEMMETIDSTEAGSQITKLLPKGVSIITATNKPEFMKQLFTNYSRQRWKAKELIILLNNDRMSIDSYRKYAKHFDQVSVYRLPQKYSLGKCLNYGISKAKYEIIAKFDDDDYYSPHYLSEAMAEFERTGANVIGKNKFYMYFHSGNKLMHASMPTKRLVAGATIMFEKRIYPGVVFSNLRKGSDMRFLNDCLKKGYKIRSTSRYNFTALRRGNQKKHTWKVTARTFRILRAKTVARTSQYRPIVNRAIPKD